MLDLDSKQSVAAVDFGLASGTDSIPAGTWTLDGEDQLYIGLAYAPNSISQIFVNLGSGKDAGQKSTSHAIGIKFSPAPMESAINMGLMLRATQSTIDIDGLFWLHDISISDAVNSYSVNAYVNGSEELKLTRLDAFIGASSRTGVIRYYGGLCLSRIAGSDKIVLDDTATVFSYPLAGGSGSSSTEDVTLAAKSDISGSHYIGGVLGLSINPDSGMGMTFEIQEGIQRSVMLAGVLSF